MKSDILVIALIIILVGSAGYYFVTDGETNPAIDDQQELVIEENAPITNESKVTTNGATDEPDPAPKEAPVSISESKNTAVEYDEDIKDLLAAEVGFTSGVQAKISVDSLKEKGESVRPSINKLLTSASEVDRLFGMYLYLEVFGNDAAITTLVKNETSFHLKSDFAKWLYLKHKFSDWESFMVSEAASLKENEINNLFSVARTRGGTIETNASMSSLGLGRDRAMERFVEQVFYRNPLALRMAEQAKTSEYMSSEDNLNNIFMSYVYANRDIGSIEELEERIMDDQNQYDNYLDVIRLNKTHTPNETVLHKIKEVMEPYMASGYVDESFLFTYADVQYLLWK